jgi:selenocysteine lyase/cysteine desulfurase
MDKREFLRTAGTAGLGLLFGDKLLAQYSSLPTERLAEEEDFWLALRAKYRLKPDYINLENGYYSMQATPVLDSFIQRVRDVNYEGAYYMRVPQVANKASVRDKLAAMAGVAPEELVITRNTTESLDTVMNGFDWKPGDEAVMAAQDYGHMLAQFKLLARRYGMVNKVVSVPADPKSDDEVVKVYADAITDKTRLLMVCHIINVTGHILPVRKIADMAHARGVQVMVDGAHAFGQFDYRIPDLGVDYYGTSLHKWLGCPLGTGFLYVRKDRIAGLWPIFGDSKDIPDADIMKLNHTGTHPVHSDLAIEAAMAFHNSIGTERKEARLRYLQTYWTAKVRGMKNVVLNTPSDPKRTCAIANVGIAGMKGVDVSKTLLDKYRIYTAGVDNVAGNVIGARVTPHVYIQPKELDTLVGAITEMARSA